MRRNRWLIALSALVVAGCQEPKTPKPTAESEPTQVQAALPKVQPEQSGAGKALFLRACANCHGTDGGGAMMRAAMPKIPDLRKGLGGTTDAELIAHLKKGKGQMPAFAEALKESEMTAVLGYVRQLGQ